MICEMCGKNVTFLRKVTIEGVLLEVCSECAKFGVGSKKEVPKEEGPKPIIAQRLEFREKRSRPRDVLEKIDKEDLVEDFSAWMFPALCDEQVVARVDSLLGAESELPAAAVKNLRVARQEEQRCLRARKVGAAPGPRAWVSN